MNIEDEIILINKPLGWTSFDVVKKVRNAISRNSKSENKESEKAGMWESGKVGVVQSEVKKRKLKIGHAGTLDPLATGLLILCTGKFTKKISEIQDAEKEYTATFVFGGTTPSYDLETELNEGFPVAHLTEEVILKATQQFTGKIQQTPPAYSAVKINGKRAYENARKGVEMEIASKEVIIREFEITAFRLPEIDVRIVCSKGTYIRSLANDFGKAVGSGAHLSALCRTRIGTFLLKDSLSPEEYINKTSDTATFTELRK